MGHPNYSDSLRTVGQIRFEKADDVHPSQTSIGRGLAHLSSSFQPEGAPSLSRGFCETGRGL